MVLTADEIRKRLKHVRVHNHLNQLLEILMNKQLVSDISFLNLHDRWTEGFQKILRAGSFYKINNF